MPPPTTANFDLIYLNYLINHKDVSRSIRITEKPPVQSYFNVEDIHEVIKDRPLAMCFTDFQSTKGAASVEPVRNVFNNCELTHMDRMHIRAAVQGLIDKNIPIEYICEVYPYISRAILMNYRRHGDDYLTTTLTQIQKLIKWRHSSFFPVSDSEPKVRKHLDEGTCYWIGRAKNMRPILIIKAINAKPYTDCASLDRAITFAFEWSKMHLLLPGIQETAYVILDVTKMSLASLPIHEVRNIIDNLTLRYPFHLDKIYVINDSILLQSAWSIVKNFLSELQKSKVHIYRKVLPKDVISEEFGPGLIEKKYGGDRPNLTSYYPYPIYTPKLDQLYSRILDPISIVGIPQISKEIPIPVNSAHVPDTKKGPDDTNAFSKLSKLRKNPENVNILTSYYESLIDIHPSVSPMVTLDENAIRNLESYFGEEASFILKPVTENTNNAFHSKKESVKAPCRTHTRSSSNDSSSHKLVSDKLNSDKLVSQKSTIELERIEGDYRPIGYISAECDTDCYEGLTLINLYESSSISDTRESVICDESLKSQCTDSDVSTDPHICDEVPYGHTPREEESILEAREADKSKSSSSSYSVESKEKSSPKNKPMDEPVKIVVTPPKIAPKPVPTAPAKKGCFKGCCFGNKDSVK